MYYGDRYGSFNERGSLVGSVLADALMDEVNYSPDRNERESMYNHSVKQEIKQINVFKQSPINCKETYCIGKLK